MRTHKTAPSASTSLINKCILLSFFLSFVFSFSFSSKWNKLFIHSLIFNYLNKIIAHTHTISRLGIYIFIPYSTNTHAHTRIGIILKGKEHKKQRQFLKPPKSLRLLLSSSNFSFSSSSSMFFFSILDIYWHHVATVTFNSLLLSLSLFFFLFFSVHSLTSFFLSFDLCRQNYTTTKTF